MKKNIDANKIILIILILFMFLPSTISIGQVSIFTIATIVTILIFIYLLIIKREILIKNIKNAFVLCVFLFACSIGISLLANLSTIQINDTFEILKYGVFALITIIIMTICHEKKYYIATLKYISIIMIIICIFGIIQYFNPFHINELYIESYAPTQSKTLTNGYKSPRIVGIKPNPSVYGLLVSIGVYINLMYFKYAKKKIWCVISIILCIINLALTLTRTIQIAFICSIILFFLIRAFINNGWKNALKTTLVLICLITIVILILPESITWRLMQVTDLSKVNTWNQRIDKWSEYEELFNNNFLVGNGPVKNHVEQIGYVDSEVVQNYIQYGAIGCIFYAIMLISPIVMYFLDKSNKNLIKYYIPILVLVVLNNISSSTLINPDTAIGVYIIIGLILAKRIINNKNSIIINASKPQKIENDSKDQNTINKIINENKNDKYEVFLITNNKTNYIDRKTALDNDHIIYISSKREKTIKKYKVLRYFYNLDYSIKSYAEMEKIIENRNNVVIYAYGKYAIKSCKKISNAYKLKLTTLT